MQYPTFIEIIFLKILELIENYKNCFVMFDYQLIIILHFDTNVLIESL